MKNTIFSIIFICSIFIMMTIACERTDLHKSSPNNDGLITPREITDCNQCPNEDDCCCGIELVNASSGDKTVRLCGTADGFGSCNPGSPSNPCSSISTGAQIKTLGILDAKLGFCMIKGNTLSITNTSLGIAIIRLTCQYDLTSPQIVLDTIPSTGTHFYLINNSCETDECE